MKEEITFTLDHADTENFQWSLIPFKRIKNFDLYIRIVDEMHDLAKGGYLEAKSEYVRRFIRDSDNQKYDEEINDFRAYREEEVTDLHVLLYRLELLLQPIYELELI